MIIADFFASLPQGLQDLRKEVENTPGAGRPAPGTNSHYAGGGSIWSEEIKVRVYGCRRVNTQ